MYIKDGLWNMIRKEIEIKDSRISLLEESLRYARDILSDIQAVCSSEDVDAVDVHNLCSKKWEPETEKLKESSSSVASEELIELMEESQAKEFYRRRSITKYHLEAVGELSEDEELVEEVKELTNKEIVAKLKEYFNRDEVDFTLCFNLSKAIESGFIGFEFSEITDEKLSEISQIGPKSLRRIREVFPYKGEE